ncbi:hypothetical protein [Nakamurella sp.]|uniref:hypothetical protein n=1 Tax=Nakamurella sp. TaxID=1869182 RepID=UPI003784838D
MDAALRRALDAELEVIRADPPGAVGFGEKAYLPYSTTVGQGLVSAPDREVTRLLSDAIDRATEITEITEPPDPVFALALLHVVGQRADDLVDGVLIRALGAEALMPTAAYLLGRAGYRGYPARRRDEAAVLRALREHLDDPGDFVDPFLRRSFPGRDFVIAALVRLVGVEQFTGVDERQAPMVGLALPDFSDAQRTELVRQLTRPR